MAKEEALATGRTLLLQLIGTQRQAVPVLGASALELLWEPGGVGEGHVQCLPQAGPKRGCIP